MTGGPAGTGPARFGHILASPPSDIEEFNPVTVSPGLPAFITMFVLAVGVVLLVIDMTRRVRRIQAGERVEQRLAAEQQRTAEGRSGQEPTAEHSAPADRADTPADDPSRTEGADARTEGYDEGAARSDDDGNGSEGTKSQQGD